MEEMRGYLWEDESFGGLMRVFDSANEEEEK